MREIHEGREYHRALCHFCTEPTPPGWVAYESTYLEDSDWMMVCDTHKYTAFS